MLINIASAVQLLTFEFSTLSTKDVNLFRVTTKPTSVWPFSVLRAARAAKAPLYVWAALLITTCGIIISAIQPAQRDYTPILITECAWTVLSTASPAIYLESVLLAAQLLTSGPSTLRPKDAILLSVSFRVESLSAVNAHRCVQFVHL